MKFRKKPIIIDAYKWSKHGLNLAGVCLDRHGSVEGQLAQTAGPHIHTLEGTMMVSDGDYIITGIKGEQYPCKPDIFKQTYECVNADQDGSCDCCQRG